MVIIRTFPLNPFGLFFFLLILWENALLLLSLLDEKAIHDILKVSDSWSKQKDSVFSSGSS